jgi:uncharacterized membrane protein YphA (DoxX/SURF4 family)
MGIPELQTRQFPPLSLGLLRIMFGVLYLDMALQKAPWVIHNGDRFGWLYGWIWTEIKNPTFEFYKIFLHDIVLPYFNFFGYFTFFAEMALGISLLLGLFTVLSGIGGALFMFNIMLGAYSVPGEWYWIWPLLIGPHIVFAHSRAGRSLGIDRVLWNRLSRSEGPQTRVGNILRRLI